MLACEGAYADFSCSGKKGEVGGPQNGKRERRTKIRPTEACLQSKPERDSLKIFKKGRVGRKSAEFLWDAKKKRESVPKMLGW